MRFYISSRVFWVGPARRRTLKFQRLSTSSLSAISKLAWVTTPKFSTVDQTLYHGRERSAYIRESR